MGPVPWEAMKCCHGSLIGINDVLDPRTPRVRCVQKSMSNSPPYSKGLVTSKIPIYINNSKLDI